MKPTPTFNQWMRQPVYFDEESKSMNRDEFFEKIGKKPDGVLPEEDQQHFRGMMSLDIGSPDWWREVRLLSTGNAMDALSWEILTDLRK